MGEKEDNLEENELKEKPKEKKIQLYSLSKLLSELLRLLFFVLIAIIVSYIMISRKLKDNLIENIKVLDEQGNQEIIFNQPLGKEWEMEEIIINTSDDFANHFVKTKIIFSYQEENTLRELSQRQNQIYAEIRKLIGVERYTDLKSIKKQEELAREIKNKVQRMLKTPDAINVYLKEFTVY